jgi:hypothetical protein
MTMHMTRLDPMSTQLSRSSTKKISTTTKNPEHIFITIDNSVGLVLNFNGRSMAAI